MAAAHWSSRFGFLMAAIGFAVGLGNIWRFPYMTGENGGGAFVIIYIGCALIIGLPILMAEILVGRAGGKSPPGSMREVAVASGGTPRWAAVGHLNLVTAFLIEVVYCVIAGWVLAYLYYALTGAFEGMTGAAAGATFEALLADGWQLLGWSMLGLVIAGGVIFGGVEKGIERSVSILMPALFVLLAGLAVYNVFAGGFAAALSYLFEPDFSKVTGATFLAAVGQAFFSIGVAMAGMMTFGAYLPEWVSIPRSALVIILADTAVAVVAGLVIFPAVFAQGLDPAAGPGLIFQTLPVAFATMPGGTWVAVLFFILLAVAAITSMVGLLEPLTAWLENAWGWQRRPAAVATVASIAVCSVLSVLSYNHLPEIGGVNLAWVMDFVPNQILLPFGGLCIAVFVGWRVSHPLLKAQLDLGALTFQVWRMLVRFVLPVVIAVILWTGLGI